MQVSGCGKFVYPARNFSPGIFFQRIAVKMLNHASRSRTGSSVIEISLIFGLLVSVLMLSASILGDSNKTVFENLAVLLERSSQVLIHALGGR